MIKRIIIIIVSSIALIACIAVAVSLGVILSNKNSKSSNTDATNKIFKLKVYIDDYELSEQDQNSTENVTINSLKISPNSLVYLNYTYIGTTDLNGEIKLNINDNFIYNFHVINRLDGYGYNSIGYLNDSIVYLTSIYEEPIITNFNGLDDSVFFREFV